MIEMFLCISITFAMQPMRLDGKGDKNERVKICIVSMMAINIYIYRTLIVIVFRGYNAACSFLRGNLKFESQRPIQDGDQLIYCNFYFTKLLQYLDSCK